MSGFHLYGAVCFYFAHLSAIINNGIVCAIYAGGAAIFMVLGCADEKDKRK